MKRFIILAVSAALLSFQCATAQSESMIWPISGVHAGEGIICRPQQYIDGEQNYGNLFITAPEGTDVICPADGTVSSFSVDYMESLTYMTTFSSKKNTFDEKILEVKNSGEAETINSKYLSGAMTITLADGRNLYISGLTGDIPFKTGQRISKGDKIGQVGYAYKAFNDPHINLSLSAVNGTVDDVMTPFGLESSFVAWSGQKEFLSEKEAGEDISVLMDSFRECYPSLYDVVTDEQLVAFQNKAAEKCRDGISYDDFYLIVRSAASAELVHDSHISILTENPFKGKRKWNSNLKLISSDGRLFVGQVREGFEEYLMKTVASVDGEPADSIVSRISGMCNLYDGENESVPKQTMLLAPNWVYDFDFTRKRTSRIVFTDGAEFDDVWFPAGQGSYTPEANQEKPYWSRYVRSFKEPVHFSRLNDSTAYFALGTFELSQVQIEEIEDSIRRLSSVPNMVVDMRNNPGGNIEVMEKMISYFLKRPSIPLGSYRKVNSNSTYRSFAHSANHAPEEIMFANYSPMEGRDGFYDYSDSNKTIEPDSLVHYPGHLFILTDETSLSAASEFPAYLVRNNRAVTVGRETGTGYHYMTANKFVDIVLPNSRIQVSIPLIQEVFDEKVCERMPAGRGLMPDYEVPVTYEEIYTSDNDPIMDKALELIASGNVEPAYVFQDVNCTEKTKKIPYVFLAALFALILSASVFVVNRTSKKK